MATGLVTSLTALCLRGGRPAAPGDEITDLDLEAERAHIKSGAITVLADPDPAASDPAPPATDPPADPDPAAEPTPKPKRSRTRKDD